MGPFRSYSLANAKAGIKTNHRFLDEAGDTAFYGKGKIPVLGSNGVSLCFILGMIKFRDPLPRVRQQILELQKQVEGDRYYRGVPSIEKRKNKDGFYFHATDDPPEVRKTFFEFILGLNCSCEAVVGRKIPELYERKHNGDQCEFYADLLAHLLKNKLQRNRKLVLNIAQRGVSTRNHVLESAKARAAEKFIDQ